MQKEKRMNSSSASCAVEGCQAESLFRCSKCGTVTYCGKDHQKSHWSQHKYACAEATVTIPSHSTNFLIAGGALIDFSEDFWLSAFTPELERQGRPYKVVDMTKEGSIIKNLSKNEYNVCVILCVHSGAIIDKRNACTLRTGNFVGNEKGTFQKRAQS